MEELREEIKEEIKELREEIKEEIKEIKEAISNIYDIVSKLEPLIYGFPEERENRDMYFREFVKLYIIEDFRTSIWADEFLSYLAQYFTNKSVPFKSYILRHIINEQGYKKKYCSYNKKEYFDGLSWNPEVQRDPLVEKCPVGLSDNPEKIPAYRYSWVDDDVILPNMYIF